jgi:hypothetical protein
MNSSNIMENKMTKISIVCIALCCSVFLINGCSSIKPEVGQVMFASPETAAAALSDAAGKHDTQRLMEIFGPNAGEILNSGDKDYDKESMNIFAGKLKEKVNFVKDGALTYLDIGNDRFPFVVPLAECDGKVFFYTEAGKDEIINRRIGRNELNAVRICRTIADLEEKNARMKLASGAAKEYTAKFTGEQDAKNGLYWDASNKDANEKSNLGALIVLASQDVPLEKRKPYYGYFYKILTAQGAAAPGGKKDYLIDGKMKNGFALIAYPANYGGSGITSFIVSKHGIVFEKDLGEDTAKIAAAMTEYNPDDTWEPFED